MPIDTVLHQQFNASYCEVCGLCTVPTGCQLTDAVTYSSLATNGFLHLLVSIFSC